MPIVLQMAASEVDTLLGQNFVWIQIRIFSVLGPEIVPNERGGQGRIVGFGHYLGAVGSVCVEFALELVMAVGDGLVRGVVRHEAH